MTTQKKRGRLIWATSPSGCGAKRHLKDFQKYCKDKGKSVPVYHLGDLICAWLWEKRRIKVRPETILNVNKVVLDVAREAVLERIENGLDKDLEENDAVLIRGHTTFLWNGCYTPVYNEPFILAHSPDMFVTFIDGAEDILRVLNRRNQWKSQNLSEKDIWLWQNVEVDNTRRYLYLFEPNENQRFFVIPVKQPAQTLYDLLFEPQKPIVYAQMPITHLEPHELEKVRQFIEQLWQYCVVFDPLTIETGVVERNGNDCAEIKVRHSQTAYRDLEWFIPQCNISIAYFVKLVFSAGVVGETMQTFQTGKEAWMIFPGEYAYSPFIHYLVMPNRIFKTPEEVLDHLKKTYGSSAEQVKAERQKTE